MRINTLQRCKPLLGTFVDITVSGKASDIELIKASDKAFSEIERIQQLMSFHDEKSELGHINRHLSQHPDQPFKVSDDMINVLSLAIELHKTSAQYFDICIAPQLIASKLLPDHVEKESTDWGNGSDLNLHGNMIWGTKPLCIDLGGIAKGYAVDCAIKEIPFGLTYTINAGGDLFESDWQNKDIAIKYAKRNQALKSIKMKNHALATSGNYYLNGQSDIINPQSQKPHHFKGCVSVFADSVMLADALTKVVMLAPKSTTKFLLKTFDAQAVLVSRWGFKRRIL